MCFAIPVKIKKIKGFKAKVSYNGKVEDIDTTLLPKARAGDWVLCNGILAVKKITSKEAEDFFNLVK